MGKSNICHVFSINMQIWLYLASFGFTFDWFHKMCFWCMLMLVLLSFHMHWESFCIHSIPWQLDISTAVYLPSVPFTSEHFISKCISLTKLIASSKFTALLKFPWNSSTAMMNNLKLIPFSPRHRISQH